MEGLGEIGGWINIIGVTGGKTERGVRLGEDGRGTAAEITESPPIYPPRHSAVTNSLIISLCPKKNTISLNKKSKDRQGHFF